MHPTEPLSSASKVANQRAAKGSPKHELKSTGTALVAATGTHPKAGPNVSPCTAKPLRRRHQRTHRILIHHERGAPAPIMFLTTARRARSRQHLRATRNANSSDRCVVADHTSSCGRPSGSPKCACAPLGDVLAGNLDGCRPDGFRGHDAPEKTSCTSSTMIEVTVLNSWTTSWVLGCIEVAHENHSSDR